MAIDDKINYEKLQHAINKKKPAKISGLSSGKIEKYEHLRDEEYYLPIKFKL